MLERILESFKNCYDHKDTISKRFDSEVKYSIERSRDDRILA